MVTRRQVAAFAETLSESHLECRQFGHAWRAYTVDKDGPRYRVTTICPRCEAKRVQTIDSRGMVVGHTNLRYPDGYLAHGIGRITGEAKGVVRLEGVHRVIDAQSSGPDRTKMATSKKRRRTRTSLLGAGRDADRTLVKPPRRSED